MNYSEHYEVHWRRFPGKGYGYPESGVEEFETEHVAWDELDAMAKDPTVNTVVLFRECTIELGRHSKAGKK